jgi:excisionase family DNA binding protein
MSITKALSVKEAAVTMAVSEQHIRSLLRSGSLEGRMIGKQWIISPQAIKSYKSKIKDSPPP